MIAKSTGSSPTKFIIHGIALLYAAYAICFVISSSFEVRGARYFVLFDDAMISMTYVKNVLHGLGLNWAKYGMPVEGYTHPLWLIPMLISNALLQPRLASLGMQALSAILMVANIYLINFIYRRHFSNGAHAMGGLLSAALLASFYSLNYWSLLGMETALQVLIVLTSFHLSFAITDGGRQYEGRLAAVLAAAALLRMDMILFAMLIFCFVYVGRPNNSSPVNWLRSATRFLIIVTVPSLLYEAFRVVYFHDVLPNTYYLKLTGIPLSVRLLRGGEEYLKTMLPLSPFVIAATFFSLHDRKRLLLIGVFFLYSAYSIWVGGDAWERYVLFNRFILVGIPGLIILMVSVADQSVREIRVPALIFYTAVVFALLNGLIVPLKSFEAYESFLNLIRSGRISSISPPSDISRDASATSRTLSWRENFDELALLVTPVYVPEHKKITDQVVSLNRWVRPDALVASLWAGIPGFFGNFKLADLHGYNDRTIARLPPVSFSAANFRDYLPGHARWGFSYVLTQLHPDVFFDGADVEACRTHGYVIFRGYWTRKKSAHVDWSVPEQPGYRAL